MLKREGQAMARLRRGRAARRRFVQEHLARDVARQVRDLRERRGWSQARLAALAGTNQNAIYRLESPRYGKATLTTLRKIAAALDVALVVRFASYSEVVEAAARRGRGGGDPVVRSYAIEAREGIFSRGAEGDAAAGALARPRLHSTEEPRGVVELRLGPHRQHDRPRPIV